MLRPATALPASQPSARKRLGTCLLILAAFTTSTIVSAQERITRARTAGQEADRLEARALLPVVQRLVDVTQAADTSIFTWDETAETGYTYNAGQGLTAEFVQKVTFPASSGTITEMTPCFFFDVEVARFDYEVVVYRNNGGQPGALVDAVPFFAEDLEVAFICLTGTTDIQVNQSMAFVGVRFEPIGDDLGGIVFYGVDEDSASTGPGFTRPLANESWVPLPIQDPQDPFSGFRNFALDLVFTTEEEPVPTCEIRPCVPSATNLCLQGDRFDVSATFVDQNGGSGDVIFAPELTPDTGYGHFGDATNVELVVKVLDACFLNRFWVFAAGLTDQGITLRVCDRQTGELRIYENPLKTPFTPINDTDAFATCP